MFKKLSILVAVVTSLSSVTPAMAYGGGYRGGYGGGWGNSGWGGPFIAGVVGGALVDRAFSGPGYYAPTVIYAQPQPVYVQPQYYVQQQQVYVPPAPVVVQQPVATPQYCRQISRTVIFNGAPVESLDTVCLQPDGSWLATN